MTKRKEVDSKPESESDRRQQAQKAKTPAKIAEKLFNDVVVSIQQGNSKESLWELGLQALEQANELSLIQKAGPIETLPIGEAARLTSSMASDCKSKAKNPLNFNRGPHATKTYRGPGSIFWEALI